MRAGEIDGVHYNFVTKAQFDQILTDGIFLEHAEVFENNYGTSKAWVMSMLKQGTDVILEIDWQGAQQIRQKMPDAISIFILPPGGAVLRQRLVARNLDNEDKIALRTEQARNEVSHYTEYDYLIVNDDFNVALKQLIEIISVARLRVSRQRQVWQELIAEFAKS